MPVPAQPTDMLQHARSLLASLWTGVLDLCLVAWVARSSVAFLLLGFLILSFAPQAQDLLIPLVDSRYYRIGLFFPLVFLLWSMPTHYAARLAIEDDARLAQYRRRHNSSWLEFLVRTGPRLLGALTFIAYLICAYRGRADFPVVVGVDEFVRKTIFTALSWFMFWCVVWFVIFLAYGALRRRLLVDARLVRRAETAVATVASPVLDWLDIGAGRSTKAAQRNDYLGRSILLAYFAAFVAVMFLDPFLVADWLPRAWCVALALGGWLPLLAYLSTIGRRLQAPLIVGTFAALAILVVVVGDNHHVRLSVAEPGANMRIPLDNALTDWAKANGCAAAIAGCPRPVIIVAAGGASRAGFFTASVIGDLLDKAPLHGLDAATVRNRLFAISSVSGGSLGAVMTVAALARGGDAARQPCPGGRDRAPLWYGDEVTNWRGCLEALMSGDFLTPTFIGLSFHDMVPLRLWRDRAALLEESWERYARFVVGEPARSRTCPFDLDCPFLALRGNDRAWLPLMILNGTSVSNGQRILTTNLAPTYALQNGRACPLDGDDKACRLFAQTYHFHDLINPTPHPGDAPPLAVATDLRLSTAATNSARFPIVSPAGEIVPPKGPVVDRIVDGGYLDNFGVLSAFDLVNAIRALQPELKPIVVVISNDPNEPLDAQTLPTTVRAKYFSDITSIFWAVVTTRDARASVGVVQLTTLVDGGNGACRPSLVEIRVWPLPPGEAAVCTKPVHDPSVISMSWWSSKPVQLRLVAELDQRSCNKDGFESIWRALSSTRGCTTP
jgi:hypothetical protein